MLILHDILLWLFYFDFISTNWINQYFSVHVTPCSNEATVCVLRPRRVKENARRGKKHVNVEFMCVFRSLNKYPTSPVIGRSMLIIFNFPGRLTTKSCQPLVGRNLRGYLHTVFSWTWHEYPRARTHSNDQEIYYVASRPWRISCREPGLAQITVNYLIYLAYLKHVVIPVSPHAVGESL